MTVASTIKCTFIFVEVGRVLSRTIINSLWQPTDTDTTAARIQDWKTDAGGGTTGYPDDSTIYETKSFRPKISLLFIWQRKCGFLFHFYFSFLFRLLPALFSITLLLYYMHLSRTAWFCKQLRNKTILLISFVFILTEPVV